MDTPFWRDAPLHHMHIVETDLDGATAAWMTEPAFTKTEYIGESDDGLRQLYLGNAIKQIYEPFGFPFEVPCFTKYVEIFNSTTIFYKLPNRNFLSLPESSMLDPVGKEEIPTYLSYVVSKMAKLNNSKPLEIAAVPQLLGRNTGAFTHTEVKNFLKEADGSLTINPYLEGLAQSSRTVMEPWGSFVCAAMVDNEPRHLGVVTNLDYIVNDQRPLKYSDFKVYDEEQKKPPGRREPLPILDSATNLKERLYRDRFKILSNITNEIKDHPGIYIDEAPCTQEKYDCVKLARCRGIDITSKIDEELEVEVDPCAEYESEIEIIFIENEHTQVPLFTGKNYRIRLREEVFSTDATQARWKVSSRPPAHFDRSKMCLEQGIVLQKNGDLLMTRLTSKDVRRHVEVTLPDGRKISIQFINAGLKLGLGDDRDVLIMWAVILTGASSFKSFFSLTNVLANFTDSVLPKPC
ncbi:unnamed protein product [Haemonchus placei]|uniref:START domain-containing protein n=1 Tax=Haemonchus placei TaxID=6290 RepID=A0A158QQW3_HAEPC|nr:unnamed protein product [Haemonchus placei]